MGIANRVEGAEDAQKCRDTRPSSAAITKLLVVIGTCRSGLRKTSAVRVPIPITPKITKIRNERN